LGCVYHANPRINRLDMMFDPLVEGTERHALGVFYYQGIQNVYELPICRREKSALASPN
jgi:hypothetical protein